MSHTKGKLEISKDRDDEGRRIIVACSNDNEFPRIPIALMEYGVAPKKAEAEANAEELVRRWNAFEKQQPPAGELKFGECNIYLMNSELCMPLGDFKAKIMIMCPNEKMMDKMEEHLKKCDRLDRSEASKADLLALCEEFMEKADDGSAEFDDPVPGSIFLRAEAAIAKAKKEG